MTRATSITEFRKTTRGSLQSHESLLESVRIKLTLAGIPVFTIYTGGIPRYLPGGELTLRKNPHQVGLPDAVCLIRHRCASCRRPTGQLVLLEMKTGGARRKPGQVRVQKLFETHGALALVIRSLDDVDDIIAAHRIAGRN